MIAMCLAAGQKTVPDDFTIHSCHCYFILAGSAEIPVLFHVEKVRDGRSYATRTVQARQKGRPIFTTTMSFVKESEQRETGVVPQHEFKDNIVRHAAPMPVDPATGEPVVPPPDDFDDEPVFAGTSPFQNYRTTVILPTTTTSTGTESNTVVEPQTKKMQQWYRARGRISEEGGHQAHVAALAYASDSYFIGTIPRIHKLWRYPFPAREFTELPKDLQDHVRKLNDFEGYSDGLQLDTSDEFQEFWQQRPEIGMMVSLDHSIYFHEPRKVKADEWMLSEMESPWAGYGRGVVTQRIYGKDGTLLATCFQEVSRPPTWGCFPRAPIVGILLLTFLC